MTRKMVDDIIDVLNTVKEDAEMALDGRWDRTDDGFETQLNIVENCLSNVKDYARRKYDKGTRKGSDKSS